MEVLKKEKQLKEIDVVIESYTLCDKCNEKVRTGSYDVFDFTFEHKTGTAYPEGGNGETDKMDLCHKCAKYAVQLLRDNGYRVTTEEWDW
jgi:hypothetical protein